MTTFLISGFISIFSCKNIKKKLLSVILLEQFSHDFSKVKKLKIQILDN